MAKAVELPFFIHGEALHGRASETEGNFLLAATVDTETTETMVDSADDDIVADLSSAGEQEIEQRCLQDVGKYSTCTAAKLLLNTYFGCCRSEHRLRNARLSVIQKQLASLKDKSQ